MNYFQMFGRPDQAERMTFLGYWVISLVIWSFMMNISLIIVIIFSIVGYHLICKPLAFLLRKSKKLIINNFFNGFDIFNAYYAGFEPGRVVRISLKLIFFFSTLIIAKILMEGYLAFI
ncbi:MAG: hypothetical protein EVA57_03310 [alpha proteobacterium HIMB59]|jgi:hypothetical protein|nr:MAG: hypothetical protein EVA57_03310 [alpha proteobacterium HIMB59]|tara:strand:+ start:3785 stop:4138 length:354 start_codon:yes stop_codon:yes gene_type:complete